MESISLDEIIKKKKIQPFKNQNAKAGKNTKGNKASLKRLGKNRPQKKGGVKKFIVTDARNRIVQRKRSNMRDARDHLGAIARRSDARERLDELAGQGDARYLINDMRVAEWENSLLIAEWENRLMLAKMGLATNSFGGQATTTKKKKKKNKKQGAQTVVNQPATKVINPNLTAHLGAVSKKTTKKKSADSKKPAKQAAKQVPDNAATMHPVMLLHQMRPGIEYTKTETTGDDKLPYFYVSVNIDGQEFTGEGPPNLKKAKAHLARDAVLLLFGVDSVFEIPA